MEYKVVASLQRSQIFRDLRALQAQAAESSGYAGPFCCFFKEKSLKTGCFESLKQALERTRSVCLRAF
jgi:hypothetical protein